MKLFTPLTLLAALSLGCTDAALVAPTPDTPLVSTAPASTEVADPAAPTEPEAGSAELRRDVGDPPIRQRTADDWLHDAAAEADAMLLGTVIDITYGESAPDSQGDTTPHTWVTWEVERAFKGIRAGTTFTGRFIGGPTHDRRHLLQVSGMPQFDLGDRDVLFVQHNGEWACPLVGGAHGRLRVVDGAVYTDDGRPLGLDAGGGVTLGPVVDLPENRSTTIAGVVLRVHGDPSPATDPVSFKPAALDAVLDLLAGLGRDFPAEREVKSAVPGERFVVEMISPDPQ